MVVWDFHARKPLQTLAVPGRAARDPLGARPAPRVRLHDDGAHLEALGRLPQGRRQLRGGRARPTIGDPAKIAAARRHQPLLRRPLPLRRQLHGRQGARLRRLGAARAEARARAEDRRARSTWSPRAGTGSASTSPARCSRTGTGIGGDDEQFLRAFALGRQGADARLRGRLPRREARPARTSCTSAARRSAAARARRRAARGRARRGGRAAPRAGAPLARASRARRRPRSAPRGAAARAPTRASTERAARRRRHGPAASRRRRPPRASSRRRRAATSCRRSAASRSTCSSGRDGAPAPLLALGPGEAALVSFVYLDCPDACPIATAVLQQLDRDVAERPELAGRVALVTRELRSGARHARAHGGAARRARAARPLALPHRSERARRSRRCSRTSGRMRCAPPARTGGRARRRHVLKVFLVDGAGRIRNVYSTGFLDARILAERPAHACSRSDACSACSRRSARRRASSSSRVRGQSSRSRRESARSASSRPPVWQRAQ